MQVQFEGGLDGRIPRVPIRRIYTGQILGILGGFGLQRILVPNMCVAMCISLSYGYLFGGPHNKKYSMLGLEWGPLIQGNKSWGLSL